MNLYDNSGIDCNKKNKNKIYDLYNTIVLNKFVHSNKTLLFINKVRSWERGGSSSLKMSQLELVFRLLAHLFSVNNTSYYFVK